MKLDREGLEQLAQDIVRNLVFTSWQLKGNEDLAGCVFMPLAFLDKKEIDKLIASKASLFYEYYDKAGPGSVNGYPVFASVHWLDADQEKELLRMVREIDARMKNAPSPPGSPGKTPVPEKGSRPPGAGGPGKPKTGG